MRFKSELSLQYDLEQQKQKLERYSDHLEDLVDERTKELHNSELWHRSLFENATDGIVVLDRNGTIVNANEKACEMHGFAWKEVVGSPIDLLAGEAKKKETSEWRERVLAGESLVSETTHVNKDGSPLHLEVSSKSITISDVPYIQSFYRDITERKRMQAHLFQSQKMESIGVLAGGIAHDFNNILTAIVGHTEVVRLDASLQQKSLRSLQVIETAARKAGGMISKLLGFARKSTYEMVPLNLNDAVYDTVKLLERALDRSINLSVELSGDLPFIRGDVNQLEQIIMNLIVNARDAMPQGGRIIVSTQFREVVKGATDVPPYVLPGEYVQLAVSDTGHGIPDHVVQKIFEPFFTTKERGKGTGLGLSMVYGAVKEHKGYITVNSRVGEGSTFIIYLPATRADVRPPVMMAAPQVDGKETILFVDDQEEVLSAVREMLTAHGYTVLTANDPAAALELFKERQHEIALVITDMVMPNIDGRELICRLRAISPELKILAVSGYMKYVAEKADIREVAGFVQKPFDSRFLLATIRRILDARPTSSAPVNA